MIIKAKHIFYVGAFIVLTILGVVFLPREQEIVFESETNDFKETAKIFVHIEGAINSPGVKEVLVGTRLFELIEISGGITEDADVSRLNLSSILKDEQKVFVPYKVTEENLNSDSYDGTNKGEATNKNDLININYAGQNDLEKLTGIGPSMALKIISYREKNGFFNSIEDIKNVSRNR